MSCHASFSGQHAKELLTSRQIVSGSPTISPVQNETGSWGGEEGKKEGGRGGRERRREGREREEKKGGEWSGRRRRVERGGRRGIQ